MQSMGRPTELQAREIKRYHLDLPARTIIKRWKKVHHSRSDSEAVRQIMAWIAELQWPGEAAA